ncbi:MAG: hypothetical protein JW795_24010, partial [Chitinivibrionales bacterium]|nr:hypothetical protein [Chitinivibrionales bacterium]
MKIDAKVLVAVNRNFYNWDNQLSEVDGGHRVDRYMREVGTIDGKATELVIIEANATIFDVWTILRNQYAEDYFSADQVEGAVLIGDIPRVTAYYGGAYIACEYFYMDIWNANAQPESAYANWSDVWALYNNQVIIDRYTYKDPFSDPIGQGDRVLDMWVSRIYATNLNHLRCLAGWYLDEYIIIRDYLNRVHDRMTGPAKVPHRGFSMGPPPRWENSDLEAYCGLQGLGLNDVIYYDYSDRTRMNLNQAAAWQAMLQAGPYGNRNYGALSGACFSSDPDNQRIGRSCYNTAYQGDIAGFEWAAVFAHSNQRVHSFHEYAGPPAYNLAGKFRNYNNQPQWTKVSSGGYSGSYYVWTNPATSGELDDYSLAEWSCVVPASRGNLYKVEMYASGTGNSPNSYFFLYRKQTTAGRDYFPAIGFGNVNQSGSSGWKLVVSRDWQNPPDPAFVWDEFACTSGDTLVFRFHPNHGASTPGRCVADAVRFTRGPQWRVGVR